MAQDLREQPEVRPDVLEDMRVLALRGTTVRELVSLIQTRLGYGRDVLLPVLWYFMKAFHLHLVDVLPLREWFGTQEDHAINERLLPLLENTKAWWRPEKTSENGMGTEPAEHASRPPTAG
jgi:hypothetical protein